MDDKRIATLEALIEELESADDPDRWLALNNQFHATIYQAANRPRMVSIIDYVRNISASYIRQFIELREHMDSSREDHRRILEACKKRDGKLAEQELRKHLQAVAQANVEFVEAGEPAP
jgi:DNA-binding GntR family transcriptional regulator